MLWVLATFFVLFTRLKGRYCNKNESNTDIHTVGNVLSLNWASAISGMGKMWAYINLNIYQVRGYSYIFQGFRFFHPYLYRYCFPCWYLFIHLIQFWTNSKHYVARNQIQILNTYLVLFLSSKTNLKTEDHRAWLRLDRRDTRQKPFIVFLF